MFSFWNRKGNKPPSTGKSPIILSQLSIVDSPKSVENELQNTIPQESHPSSLQPQEDLLPSPAIQAPQESEPDEPVVAAVTNPHDDAIAEVRAKLLQVEQLTSPTRSRASSIRILPTVADGPPQTAAPTISPATTEKLYDPATGIERAVLDPDLEESHDEVWTHLTRIRELQSEIARMHMHMEGIDDGIGLNRLDVDADIDVDSVPTQEEEEAAKRRKEFEKLPGRFKGRSNNIEAMMNKLDDLSQAVTSFHALQAPPLNFESTTATRENTYSDTQRPISPASIRIKQAPQSESQLADSPTSTHGTILGDALGQADRSLIYIDNTQAI